MRKFECNNCTNQHCYAENIQGEKPSKCLFDIYWDVDWREVKVESKLPKLTAEALSERGIEWPEWCRVGAWVYHIALNQYAKIRELTSGGFIAEDGTAFRLCDPDYFKQARIRPWTLKEAPLVSKIVFRGNFGIATLYYHCNERKFGYNINHRDICAFVAPEDMVRDFTLLDGSPCGVLEVVE